MRSSGAEDAGPPEPALTLLEDVRWHGASIPGARIQALLAALAMADGVVGEQRLIEEIWGDDLPANPTKALQVVVSRARTATTAEAVVRTAHGYRLGDLDTDVRRVRDHRREARRAEARGDWEAAVEAAASVTSLVVADAGEGELRQVREQCRRLISEARESQGRALSALGRHAEALPLLDRGADETSVVALLRSEAEVRGVPTALEHYEQIRQQYAERLGVDPGPDLAALHAELLARDHPVREGLVYEASRLIGRDRDVRALAETIRSSRVTSIVGPGGLGKTRLAHLMGRLAEEPSVHFVELAGVTSPDGVAVEVGDVLGVRESVANRLSATARRTDLAGRIVDQVGVAPALLILDNCEHLVDAVADLVSLLIARTPALRVLTTSRAPLGLAAERVYQLPQLGLDDAVELFTERATAARPGVRLHADEVRGLVGRLDGLPLAVELAAAKVRVMSVGEIQRRLDDRFALLRGGARDAPDRHQTLLAVIDWSWNLLDDDQRAALRRLSVFRDGFALGAADAVVGGEALTAVSALVDQSLVTVLEGAGGVRYRLLETVRDFGQARLVAAGEDVATAQRLRAWATDFALAAERTLFSPRQVETMATIRAEEGNLVDVLRRALRERDASTTVSAMACLSDFWTIEGSHLKVVGLGREVEEVVADAEVAADLVPALHTTLAAITFNSLIFSDVVFARALARLEALQLQDPGSRSGALTKVLLAARMTRNLEDPERLDELCADPDPRVCQVANQWASQFYENLGDVDEAVRRAERSLEQTAARDDGPWSAAMVAAQLAGLCSQIGDVALALDYAGQALPVMEALGATEDVAQLKAVLAVAAIEDGRFDEAERIFDEIAAEDGDAGMLGAAIIVACGRPEVDLAAGRVAAGLAGYRAAVRTTRGRELPGLGLPAGYEPWVLYAEAAALSAHVRHGHSTEVVAIRDDLRAKVPRLLAGEGGFIDFPVVGAALFALSQWELAEATRDDEAERSVRLLLMAEAFGYNRQLPSLSWAPAVARAEAAAPGVLERVRPEMAGRRAPDLRDEVARLVDSLPPGSAPDHSLRA